MPRKKLPPPPRLMLIDDAHTLEPAIKLELSAGKGVKPSRTLRFEVKLNKGVNAGGPFDQQEITRDDIRGTGEHFTEIFIPCMAAKGYRLTVEDNPDPDSLACFQCNRAGRSDEEFTRDFQDGIRAVKKECKKI